MGLVLITVRNINYLAAEIDRGNQIFTSESVTAGTFLAVGFNLASFNGANLVNILVDGQDQLPLQLGANRATSFIGFIDTNSISYVNFMTTASNSGVELDFINFTTATGSLPVSVSGVPELSTGAMVLVGFGGLSFLVLRKAQKGDADRALLGA